MAQKVRTWDDDRPIYRQLMEELIAGILNRTYPEGEMLPLEPAEAVMVWVIKFMLIVRQADQPETASCSSLARAFTQKFPVEDQEWLRAAAPQPDMVPSPQSNLYTRSSPSGSVADVL